MPPELTATCLDGGSVGNEAGAHSTKDEKSEPKFSRVGTSSTTGCSRLTCSDRRRERQSLPNVGVHVLLNGSACGQNGVVLVSLSTNLRWFRRGAAAFERTFPGLIASTLGKEFGAAYVCPICDRAFDLPPIIRS